LGSVFRKGEEHTKILNLACAPDDRTASNENALQRRRPEREFVFLVQALKGTLRESREKVKNQRRPGALLAAQGTYNFEVLGEPVVLQNLQNRLIPESVFFSSKSRQLIIPTEELSRFSGVPKRLDINCIFEADHGRSFSVA